MRPDDARIAIAQGLLPPQPPAPVTEDLAEFTDEEEVDLAVAEVRRRIDQ